MHFRLNVGAAFIWLSLRPRHQGLFTGQGQLTHTSASNLVNILVAGHIASQPPFTAMCALKKGRQSSHGPKSFSTLEHMHVCAHTYTSVHRK